MKKNIRQIKQELRNFARRRGNEDRSPESDAFIDKVQTIKDALFGCIEAFDDASDILEFLQEEVRGSGGEEKELWRHLYNVCEYLAGESDEKPDSMEVSKTCQELEKYKFDYKGYLVPRIKEAVEEDFNNAFHKGDPKAIELLKDTEKAQEWYDEFEQSGVVDWLAEYLPGLEGLAGNADLINRVDNTDQHWGEAGKWIADWYLTEWGPHFFEQFRKEFLGKDYTTPIEYVTRRIDNLDNQAEEVKNYSKRTRHLPLRKKNNSTRIGNFANNLDSRLIEAASRGQLNKVKSLVEQGADVDAKTIEFGWTALAWAAEEGHLDVVQFLVEKGADVDAKTEEGRTALILTAGEGHLGIVQFLVEKGADVNAQNKAGVTALIDAAEGGHLDVVKFLVEEGSDVEAKNSYGMTALILAAWSGHLDVVRFLVEHGADVNAEDKDGFTALIHAAYKGHLSVVKYLVKLGADTRGCIGLAEKMGHTKVVSFLRRYEDAVENRTEREFWEEYNSWEKW